MVRYKVGDKVIYKTSNMDAWNENLFTDEERENIERDISKLEFFTSFVHKDNYYKDLKFYGEVIKIEEGKYADDIPYRLIHCSFPRGKKITEIGFMETDKSIRKANILEKILFKILVSKPRKILSEPSLFED